MRDEQEKMRRLFRKYLANECSPEEKSELMIYMDKKGSEPHVREWIFSEFGSDTPTGENSLRVLEEVHGRFEWARPAGRSLRIGRRTIPIPIRWMVAACFAAVLCLAALAYFYNPAGVLPEPLSIISTGVGERTEVKLADGTIVWLNAASKLKYPAHFSGNIREVKLEGEAFFEVAGNPEVPFVIRSGKLKTTVTGTSFNVRAYEEDKTMSVAVLTGTVRVASPDTELSLEPNQQAVFDKEHLKLDKKPQAPASEIASWKEGMLQFRNTTFSEVTAVLRRSTGIDIRYDPRLENCAIIHADFKEHDSLESILGTLMISVNGSVEKADDGAYVLKSTVDCY